MKRHKKKGPRSAARAKDVQLLRAHHSSAAQATQVRPYTDDSAGPLRVRPLAVARGIALVVIDGVLLAWDADALARLHAEGWVRCDCGRCSEATTQ